MVVSLVRWPTSACGGEWCSAESFAVFSKDEQGLDLSSPLEAHCTITPSPTLRFCLYPIPEHLGDVLVSDASVNCPVHYLSLQLQEAFRVEAMQK